MSHQCNGYTRDFTLSQEEGYDYLPLKRCERRDTCLWYINLDKRNPSEIYSMCGHDMVLNQFIDNYQSAVQEECEGGAQ